MHQAYRVSGKQLAGYHHARFSLSLHYQLLACLASVRQHISFFPLTVAGLHELGACLARVREQEFAAVLVVVYGSFQQLEVALERLLVRTR